MDRTIIDKKYTDFQNYFGNPERQENIRNSREEQFQEGFLRELFVNILNYTLNPDPNFNLTTELDFFDFVIELNKAIKKSGGKKPSKSDEMEWMVLFEAKKAEAQALKSEIEKTDKEIDQLVYELYGLTERGNSNNRE